MIEYTKEHPLRVVTLFSGYDAQLLALKRLKRDYPDFDFTCVAWSDIDKYVCKAHDALHPETQGKNWGDVCTIDWAQVPDFDLLTYSFPCTAISSAGRQDGLTEGSGTASSLLWECKRAIIAKHPRYLIMENVAALLSEKFRHQFLKWTSFLESEGYSNFTKILNAKDYGVAQNRERVFCVSIRDLDAHFYFPEPFPLTKRLKDYLEDDVDESYYLDEDRVRDVISPMLAENRDEDKMFFNVKRGGYRQR